VYGGVVLLGFGVWAFGWYFLRWVRRCCSVLVSCVSLVGAGSVMDLTLCFGGKPGVYGV